MKRALSTLSGKIAALLALATLGAAAAASAQVSLPYGAFQPRDAQTGLTLNGNVSATIEGDMVRLQVERVTSTRSEGPSGDLRIVLWASRTVPDFGVDFDPILLASLDLPQLPAGQEQTNIDQTVPFTPPPAGCYYLTVALQERQSGDFFFVDLRTLSEGGVPDDSGHHRFAFGGATCSGTAPCSANATTACLLNGRFRTQVRFRNTFNNQPANTDALRKPVTGFANSNFETAFFYFNNPDNIEVLVKVLDQGNTNPAGEPTIAVLFGSATPLRTELTITDTQTGTVKTYLSPFNSHKGGTDFRAFVK